MFQRLRAKAGCRGSALILFTLMLPTVIVPMAGLAIDGTVLALARGKLSAAVDGGAIAAARTLSAGMSFEAQRQSATRIADQFVRANFPPGYWGSRPVVYDEPIAVREGTGSGASLRRRTVTIKASVEVPLIFMRIFGRESATVRAQGQAARRDVRMVLVLDRSSSMSGVIGDLKNAAAEFVNKFAEGRDQVGLVVFGGSAIVAFPPRDPNNPGAGPGPASNFKSATPSVASLIGNIAWGSNTGTAEALTLAYRELKKNPLDGALNLIVLFTDGLPNGISAYFNEPGKTVMTAAGGKCTYKTAGAANTRMIGFISQQSGFADQNGTVSGLYQIMNLTQDGDHPTITDWMKSAQESVIGEPASKNCKYQPYANRNSMSQEVGRIPSVDLYGNRTDGNAYLQSDHYKKTFKALDLTKPNNPYQIGLASWNATEAAGRAIRADGTLSPVIYCIGYDGGSEKPDELLMKRLANVDAMENTTYDPSKPAGLYVKAPTPAQLSAAFGKVASEILRLTQ